MASERPPGFMLPRMDRNERIQLSIKNTSAIVTDSSIYVRSDRLRNFNEVSTTKHSPSKFDAALRICGDLSLRDMMLL